MSYIYEIRPVGNAYGVYFTHPGMLWWSQKDVFETLEEARREKFRLERGK